jgi:hypothetical protein
MKVVNLIKNVKIKCCFLTLCLAVHLNYTFAQKKQSTFRAAVVKVNITPTTPQWLRGYDPRESTGVLDDIFLKIVAMDDGTKQFFLVSSDLVGLPPAQYHRVTSILENQHGIPPEQVWWSATHTHSAPGNGTQFKGIAFPSMANRSQLASKIKPDPSYTILLEQKLIDGVLEAKKNLEPAKLGVGWGFSQANINRRAIDANGKASLGLNPDGPVDRRIGLLRIDKENGEPLVLIANYAIHGTVLGGESSLISGDAPGVAAEYVEEKLGAPMLFINGAAGNLAPIYSVYPNAKAGHLSQFQVLLGDRILEANQKIETESTPVHLNTGSIVVETPRRADLEWSSDLSEYSATNNKGQSLVRLPIKFLKINDNIAIWSAPIELFCEISNEIRDRSPFPFTFYFGYTNGSLGYLPTAEAWGHGGYEPSVSPFTPAAAKDLTESVISYLQSELQVNEN